MTPLTKPVTRKSSTPAGRYGKDANRRIAITLLPGPLGDDMIELRPLKTQRGRKILVSDLWSFMIRCEANKAQAEKLAARKAKRAASKEAAAWKRQIRKPLPEA